MRQEKYAGKGSKLKSFLATDSVKVVYYSIDFKQAWTTTKGRMILSLAK